jgi:predicted ferric reductase
MRGLLSLVALPGTLLATFGGRLPTLLATFGGRLPTPCGSCLCRGCGRPLRVDGLMISPPTVGHPSPRTFPGSSRAAELDQPTREGLVAAGVAVGAGLVVLMWWADTSPASVQGAGAWLTAAGRITGLLGTYLIVVGVLLMSRVTWLDRLIGMDRLAMWHRRNAEYSVTLLVAHAVLTIWGYAVTAHEGVIRETRSVVLSYPDMLTATVALGLMVVIGVISARAIRRRISYQAWYFIHLYAYLALALSFAHQFATGADFATHPFNRAAWIALYAGVGLLLVVYRVVKPLRDGFRHRLRVFRMVREGPHTVSVYLRGRRLEELRAESGQFFMWRFLTRDGWWQAHPYSLSVAPNGQWLRVTVKALGDHSRDLPRLRRGTPVLAEGPYGAFTSRRRRLRKVLLIGGGVGITPLRALFESLPGSGRDITLLYRARTTGDIVFRAELDAIAKARHARVGYLVGSSTEHPDYLTGAHLRSLLPDITAHDIYVCGPPGMVQVIEDALQEIGVPRRQVHTENFEL